MKASDNILASLVMQVEYSKLYCRVTLILGSVVLSGTMVSSEEYFVNFANGVVVALSKGIGNNAFNSTQSYHDYNIPVENSQKPEVQSEVKFINLKDVQLSTPANHQLGADYFPYWRIRFDHVTAWTLG